ncbi:uncharacterized protein LOC126316917 isoform X2 [Schistocerca gregaria]|nr:uncharacterized protein LOC126316917 isoform X2 [Schistocerca gregaria]
MIKNLYSLAEKQKCPIPPVLFPASGFTIFEPYGVVLVISPWNYPLQLSILPLIGAIAAGNCVLLKPSELSPATSTWILDYMSKYVDKECFQVVLGAVEETSALLKLPWNYIFYTGGGRVGRIIAHAAAEHLTPTTLELGGRNPVILDRGIDLDVSIKRLVLAKFVNCGQTCVAPNHVYVHESMIEEVIETVKNVIVEFYTDDPQKSSDYSRIITKDHLKHLQTFLDPLDPSTIVFGNVVDLDDLYFSPTLVLNPPKDASISQEEIFGPILPFYSYSDLSSLIDTDLQERSLVICAFTNDAALQKRLISETSSGTLSINDALTHVTCRELPFGGVGSSGYGQYYGKYSFETFSHRKSVLHNSQRFQLDLRSPPFTQQKIDWILRLKKLSIPMHWFLSILTFLSVFTYIII